jgi:hypothetical protein
MTRTIYSLTPVFHRPKGHLALTFNDGLLNRTVWSERITLLKMHAGAWKTEATFAGGTISG